MAQEAAEHPVMLVCLWHCCLWWRIITTGESAVLMHASGVVGVAEVMLSGLGVVLAE